MQILFQVLKKKLPQKVLVSDWISVTKPVSRIGISIECGPFSKRSSLYLEDPSKGPLQIEAFIFRRMYQSIYG